jgi:hypothetical protein
LSISALANKISGEALTAGRSATLEFPLQVVEIHHEGIDLRQG